MRLVPLWWWLRSLPVPLSTYSQISAVVSAARDTRREGMLVGGTNKKKTVRYELDVTAKDDVVSTFAC